MNKYLCDLCRQSQINLICNQCELQLCNQCDTNLHQGPMFNHHRVLFNSPTQQQSNQFIKVIDSHNQQSNGVVFDNRNQRNVDQDLHMIIDSVSSKYHSKYPVDVQRQEMSPFSIRNLEQTKKDNRYNVNDNDLGTQRQIMEILQSYNETINEIRDSLLLSEQSHNQQIQRLQKELDKQNKTIRSSYDKQHTEGVDMSDQINHEIECLKEQVQKYMMNQHEKQSTQIYLNSQIDNENQNLRFELKKYMKIVENLKTYLDDNNNEKMILIEENYRLRQKVDEQKGQLQQSKINISSIDHKRYHRSKNGGQILLTDLNTYQSQELNTFMSKIRTDPE